MLSIRLSDEIENRLRVLSETTKRPKSFYVREALERSLDGIEDAYLAESEYEKFLKSGEKAIPIDEVEAKLGLED